MILIQSGGIDSTLLQYKYQREITGVIHINYGQGSYPVTKKYVTHHSKILKHSPVFQEVPIFQSASKIFSKKAYLDKAVSNMPDTYSSMGFIHGRGLLFFALAVDYAASKGESEILVGAQHDPFFFSLPKDQVIGDTTYLFLDYLQNLLNIASPNPFQIVTPLLHRSKKSIIKEAHNTFDLNYTYSCELHPRCGKCRQCSLIKKYFAQFNISTSWL